MDGGNLPISRQLIVSLTLALAFFNQFLFWSLAFALRGEERDALAARFDVITLVIGIVVLTAAVVVFLGARVHRWTDWVVLTLVAVLAVSGVAMGVTGGISSAVPWVLASNTLMVIVLSRGWLKKFLIRSK